MGMEGKSDEERQRNEGNEEKWDEAKSAGNMKNNGGSNLQQGRTGHATTMALFVREDVPAGWGQEEGFGDSGGGPNKKLPNVGQVSNITAGEIKDTVAGPRPRNHPLNSGKRGSEW